MKKLSFILLLTLMGLLSSGFSTIDLNKVNQSVQCSGTTKKGLRCKNRTLNASGYCYLHEGQAENKKQTDNNQKLGITGQVNTKEQRDNQSKTVNEPSKTERRSTSVQCSGTTKAGKRCKRMTYNVNGRCYQH